jgi:outer membrane receptor protein involved in Fe transport
MRLYNRRFGSSASALLILALSLTPCVGQTLTGGIRGVVTDISGAIVPNATVVAKNVATNVEHKTVATDEGVYLIPRIPPGIYVVTVEVKGFKKAEVKDVEVAVGKDTVVDVKLEPGEIAETITVTGGGEGLVEKDTAQISTRFSSRIITDLPVNTAGGGLDRVALLTPGVTPGFGNVNANGVTLSVNGNRARANNFTIDGVDNNDLSIGGPNYFITNPDLVQEYQVVTNNFSAEYGRNQGAIVNIVSRQGTNEYHGSVSWFHRDRKLFDSLTNLERRTGQKDPAPNLINVFSYGVGGRIVPNKVFFFTAGQFFRNPGIADLRTTALAPTPDGIQRIKAAFPNSQAAQYYADFSAFSLPIGNPQIRPDVPQSTITMNTGTGPVTIPMAAPQRLVKLNTTSDEYNVRIDANLNDKNRIWGRYFFQNSPGKDQLVDVRGWTGDIPARSQQAGGGWSWNTSLRSVNEFRFNYSRLFVKFGGGNTGGKGQIPDPANIDKALTFFNLAFTAANGAPLLTVGPATNLPQGRIVEAFQFTDNFQVTKGRHQIKLGVDYRRLRNAVPFLPFVNGSFLFSTAQRIADNQPNSLTVAFGPSTLRYTEFDQFYYLQDDWRVKPNLTFNLGLRYENTGQPINLLNEVTLTRERNPQQAFWRQDLPLEARIVPKIPTDKNNWAPRVGFVYTPRFGGFLKNIFGEDKTIIRGGYTVAYDPAFYNLLLNISTSSPTVFLTTTVLPVPDPVPSGDKVRGSAVNAGVIRFNTFDPRFFNRTIVKADFRSPYVQQWSLGIQREFRNNVIEVRYVGNHQVGLFQTINANPFIGNFFSGFSRQFRDQNGQLQTMTFPGFPNLLGGARPLTCTDNPATPDNEGACNGRLFPFGAARERINGAQATYNGLQMRIEGRLLRDVTYRFNYTWSHTIDNSSEVFNFATGNSVAVAQNPLDITRSERGNSGFDIRHNASAYFIWDLPFGKEQKGFLGRLVGGWQLNGIVLLRSGRPFTPVHTLGRNPYEDSTFLTTFIGSSALRPFLGNPKAPVNTVAITDIDACLFYGRCGTLGGLPVLRTSPTGFYSLNDLNRGIFTPVTPNDVRFIINGPGAALKFGTPFGNVGRNVFRGDRLESFDLSLFKTTRINERVSIQYRLNLFNAFNHPFFGDVPNSINLENVNFFNFQENSGGRRVIEMGLRVIF